VARHAGDRNARRYADEDQQRRHQEAAADAEHAGDESDREPHSENEEDINWKVGDRKADLHGRNSVGSEIKRRDPADRQLSQPLCRSSSNRLYSGDHPAIDAYDGARQIGSSFASQEGDRIRIFLRVAIAPERDRRRAGGDDVLHRLAFPLRPLLIEKADALGGEFDVTPRRRTISPR
jgi:hypothetical protein